LFLLSRIVLPTPPKEHTAFLLLPLDVLYPPPFTLKCSVTFLSVLIAVFTSMTILGKDDCCLVDHRVQFIRVFCRAKRDTRRLPSESGVSMHSGSLAQHSRQIPRVTAKYVWQCAAPILSAQYCDRTFIHGKLTFPRLDYSLTLGSRSPFLFVLCLTCTT